MRVYFSLITVFCIVYYCVICLYTRRWNSTFAPFWLLAGIFHGVIGFVWSDLFWIIQNLIVIGLMIGGGIFLIVETAIVYGMFRKITGVPKYLIVLGAQVRGTFITNSLKRRLDKAYQLWKCHPETVIIVSGGQGKGEDISEAEAMYRYLTERGVVRSKILKEDRSTTTWENLTFSKKKIFDSSDIVGVVTNNFHVYRSVLLAKKAGYENVYGISASSNHILLLNYMVREFFAVAKAYLSFRA